MLYAVELAFDPDNTERRLELRPAHRELLKELFAKGTLKLSGPWEDDSGALLIFDTDAEGIERILGSDPYLEAPGVTVPNFLRPAKSAMDGEAPPIRTCTKDVRESMKNLRMDAKFAQRNVNEGFSGGEKKRHEILQLELLKPKMAILDETDSGLDVDALKVVSEGVNRAKAETNLGVLLITHYTRILRYIQPDYVHVIVNGRIVEEGGSELADRLEDEGYDRFLAGQPEPAEGVQA